MEGRPPQVDFCIRCGEYLRPGITFCPKCGTPVPGMGGQAPASATASGARRVTWAGILLFLAGIVGLVMAGYTLATADEIMALAEEIYGSQVEGMESVVYVLAGFWVMCGAMSMLGGFFALRRRHYALVVIGAVLAVFTGGFFFEGTIMGLIALVLLLRSRQEFR